MVYICLITPPTRLSNINGISCLTSVMFGWYKRVSISYLNHAVHLKEHGTLVHKFDPTGYLSYGQIMKYTCMYNMRIFCQHEFLNI
jgi:hypothetical protein